MMHLAIRITAAIALTFAIAAAVPQNAIAATSKHHHHATKSGPSPKPTEQYLRSASPDPEHGQR
jgi:hypothetical protein